LIPLTLAEIAEAVRGTLHGDGSVVATHVTHDSRSVEPGSLFVALRGEHADGADFVEGALGAGAVAAITSVDGPGARILTDDPRFALQRVATIVRARSQARVVAITGSAGKTLTKDLAAAAVATQRETVATPGNFNNELGVPLTLCMLETSTEVLVAEVGSRGPGHIAALTPILRPDVVVVLNVGDAHLGEFGSLEQTARSKAELVEGLDPSGVAVLNADDERTRAMRALAPSTLLFGAASDADVRQVSCDLDEHARAQLTVATPAGTIALTVPLPGEHLAANALAALTAAHALGLDLDRAAKGIEEAETTPGRMRRIDVGSWLIIDDAYNASPESMRAALKTLAHVGRTRQTWAVLGSLAELGDATAEAHDGIGRLATRLGIGRLIAVGEDAGMIARAAILEGMSPDDARTAATRDEAEAIVRAHAEPGAVILVKASHASRLDLLVAALERGADA
jgi:UDP-N-acetylmuramoyl-tripeptide--D-alanyl-D-alanine ligase